MNPKDRDALTEHWHQQTNYLNAKVDEAFREAQDVAYALGVARGKEDANARHEPRQRLTNGTWYWVRYEGLNTTYEAPAMYRSGADAFYSFEFSGIPKREVFVLREA